MKLKLKILLWILIIVKAILTKISKDSSNTIDDKIVEVFNEVIKRVEENK